MQNRFNITTLTADDANIAPLSVGALTEGITLRELVAAYQPFGNGGKYYSPTSYTHVVDSKGKVVLQHKYTPVQAISEESAYVMNKLMQTVIEGPNGTGRAARLVNTPLIGKTGTSQDWHDLSFVGCTPDYVRTTVRHRYGKMFSEILPRQRTARNFPNVPKYRSFTTAQKQDFLPAVPVRPVR